MRSNGPHLQVLVVERRVVGLGHVEATCYVEVAFKVWTRHGGGEHVWIHQNVVEAVVEGIVVV
jgi:hypothetical protein